MLQVKRQTVDIVRSADKAEMAVRDPTELVNFESALPSPHGSLARAADHICSNQARAVAHRTVLCAFASS
jgi:hypothetical protein